ncbi:hypothetical protein BDZ89DRAFT_1113467 [Hymenopellis radicata]|nr:hypothetical protein BDZ89DRAFT_1113467 [Hymenopellis radicata]
MATTVVNETKPQPAETLPDAALAYKYVKFVNRMTTDWYPAGSTLLSSWRPNLDIGWYYLGQGAEVNSSQPPFGLIVHALEPDALRDVVGWERVWDDAGKTWQGTDYALWRGVPPNEDVVGGIFSTNKDRAEPDSEQRRGIKAIRRDLLVMDDTFQIWSAIPLPPAVKDASVWKTWGRAPPRDRSFSLDPNKTLEMPGEWSWNRASATVRFSRTKLGIAFLILPKGKSTIPEAVHSQKKDDVGSK